MLVFFLSPFLCVLLFRCHCTQSLVCSQTHTRTQLEMNAIHTILLIHINEKWLITTRSFDEPFTWSKKRFQCNVYKCKDHTIFYEEMRANSSQNNLNELYRMCQQFVITADQCYSVLLSLIGHIARSINVHVGNALTHNSPYLLSKMFIKHMHLMRCKRMYVLPCWPIHRHGYIKIYYLFSIS